MQSLKYDPLGRLVEWGRGEAGTEHYRGEQRQAYDVADRMVLRAQVNGVLHQFFHDAESRPIRSLRHAGFMVQQEEQDYDAQGRVIRMRGPQGRSLQLRYDESGRPSLWIDSLGREHHRGMPAPEAPARVQPLRDDWGRAVQSRSPDAGVNTRWFDAADRLVAGQDALGHRARYVHDSADRIVEQHILDNRAQTSVVTRWRYEGQHLVALEHPTQSEYYTHDARGLVLTREVRRPGLQALTLYRYDEEGRLLSESLPDGSLLMLRRDGLGQIVALERERVHRPWLRWLMPTQTLARHMKQDGAGLREVTLGNGLVQAWERSGDGALARMVLRDARPSERLTQAETRRRVDRLMDLLGMASAQAGAVGSAQLPAAASSPQPGALGLARDAGALLDHRYLWDAQGNLLLDADPSRASSRSYAYDRGDRLIIEAAQAGGESSFNSRWLFDRSGRRLLQQLQQQDPQALQAGTQRVQYAEGTHRWLAASPASARAAAEARTRYDAGGQPLALQDGTGQHLTLQWDALGRLSALADAQRGTQARYVYNHRGERIAKEVGQLRTQYLYQDRRLSAELDAQGRLQRQYLYLGSLPLAVIDTPDGRAPAGASASVADELGRLWQAWFGGVEHLVWLHGNHLGAVELVTDAAGRSVWQGEYSAYGALLAEKGALAMNLRLPGQYFDAESGLHYNDHRYYDPRRGEYISPDPLGTPDGPNPYSYVRGNPQGYVDPQGLVLFAFDGTGNDESIESQISNVVRFRNAYLDAEAYYITGPGTTDPRSGIEGGAWDALRSTTGKQRITQMIKYLNEEADGAADDAVLDIDVTGFSRGAAQARDFANQVAMLTKNGWYEYKDDAQKVQCQRVNFRFMGIFDTVLSTHRGSYQLGIPDEFQHVAHAVALNEYRALFPLESIVGGTVPADKTRIERGFLGSHSDIGGSFPDGDLAQVALVWMIDQAKAAGLTMREADRNIIADPVLHDKSANLYAADGPAPTAHSADRAVRWQSGGSQRQRTATMGGMSYTDTVPFIRYDHVPKGIVSGKVDMAAYARWLDEHGYNLNLNVGG